MIALVSDDVLLTINTIELVGIVYLAIAHSGLRERVSKLEGRADQKNVDNGFGRGPK